MADTFLWNYPILSDGQQHTIPKSLVHDTVSLLQRHSKHIAHKSTCKKYFISV